MTLELETRVSELCSSLVQIPSYSGQEGALVNKLQTVLHDCGFDAVSVDCYGNILGQIKGKHPGPRLLFDAHLDTVPADNADQWQFDPFGGEILEGRLYGRGASDMKGALSAMIIAAHSFSVSMGREFAGEICVAGVVHEECFEGVAAREITRQYKPDYVIIGEATGLNLNIGQRGRAEIVLESFGVPAHSASPERGVNAVYHMCRIIEGLQSLETETHAVLGKGILVVTDIKSSPYPGASVIPHHCRATCDRRLLVGETPESVLEPVKKLLGGLETELEGFNARAAFATDEQQCYTGRQIKGERFFPGWLQDEKELLIQRILAGLRSIGLGSEISHYSFCTNGSHYAGEKGIFTLGFGPSFENLAHITDEFIETDQLGQAALGYAKIMEILTKVE